MYIYLYIDVAMVLLALVEILRIMLNLYNMKTILIFKNFWCLSKNEI